MPVKYSPAVEVQDLARELIREHHDHLINTRVDFVFRDTAAVEDGETVFGKARKVSGLMAFQTRRAELPGQREEPQPYFLIEVARPAWNEIDEPGRLARLDSLLCRCWAEEETLSILKPDIREFSAVVARHGLYTEPLRGFFRAAQGELAIEGNEPGPVSDEDAHETLVQAATIIKRGQKAAA